jgi:hypothetical protein
MLLKLLIELKLLLNLLNLPLPNMIKKNFKRDLVDLQVESLLSRLEEPPKLKLVSLKIELRTHSVLPELLEKKVLFQEVVLPFSTLKELLRTLKVQTSIKILVSKLSEKLAKSHAKLSAKTLDSKDPLLSINFLKLTLSPTVSMLPQVFTVT